VDGHIDICKCAHSQNIDIDIDVEVLEHLVSDIDPICPVRIPSYTWYRRDRLDKIVLMLFTYLLR
jgi:hypothetical protein